MALIVTILALALFAYRVYSKKVTRLEWTIFALLAVHTIVVQECFIVDRARWRFDERYLIPALPLLWAYIVIYAREWGLKKYLKIILVAMVVFAFAMGIKGALPFSTRAGRVAACEWAASVIRNDWKGPKFDQERRFQLNHFSLPNRPAILGMARTATILNARYSSRMMKAYDTPDYVFFDAKKPSFCIWNEADYVLFAEKQIGKHRYLLYKRR